MNVTELLALTISRSASDLHLIDSFSPTLRIQGELRSVVTMPALTNSDIQEMVFSLLSPPQREILISNQELDFSTVFQVSDGSVVRFRVNAYYQRGTLAASFRLIPSKIKSIDELNLPQILHELTRLRQGFVLVTGPSGQGKSTTLASIIEEINRTRTSHIVTLEDPIEHIYPKGKAIISQREMYQDTHSFGNALKHVLREDPDIVFIGEMRDYETISAALTIAETGHLVFSTLHTNSASQTIDRIVDIFPQGAKEQVRIQLSMVISAVVSQRLIPTIEGGRTPACEILLGVPSVRNIIREGKSYLIDNVMQTSADNGMMLFEEHLKQLVVENIISHDIALEYAIRPDRYLQLVQR